MAGWIFILVVLLAFTAVAWLVKWSEDAQSRAAYEQLWLRYRFLLDECGEAAQAADARWLRISGSNNQPGASG